MVLGFTWFADTNVGNSQVVWIIGVAHGILHLLGGFVLVWLFARINLHTLGMAVISVQQVALFALEMLLLGSVVGGVLVGCYLLFSNLVLECTITRPIRRSSVRTTKTFCACGSPGKRS